MSTKVGTAANYLDLLAEIDSYLTTTGHAWGKVREATGNGDLVNYLGTATSVAETFTLTATSATNFTVVGSVSGAFADATVGTPYTSARVAFTITAGTTAFVAGDKFYLSTSPKWTRLRGIGCGGQDKITATFGAVMNLFDGDQNTRSTSATTSASVEFEMHRPTEVREILLQTWQTTSSPRDYALQWKDNSGDAWTTAQSWTAQTWATNQEAKLHALSSAPGAHRFWRFQITAANGTALEVSKLELREKVSDAFGVESSTSYAWRAPGLDGTKQIHVGVQTYGRTDSDTFNLGFTGFRAFDSTQSAETQPNGVSARWLSLVNSPIGYWLIVNGQRFILVTKAAGVYQIAYCGFGLPYEPPSVHAYPQIIGASSDVRTTRYDSISAAYRHPMDPGAFGNSTFSGGGLAAMYPDAQWRSHANRTAAGTPPSGEGTFASNMPGKVWPAQLREGSEARPFFIRENIDGSRPLLPGVIHYTANPVHVWGEFDGYFWTTGFGTVSEATIREADFDHLVVGDTFRTAVQNYAAVRLD